MISERTVKQYCKDFHLIENYQQAVNDDSQMWDCHHKSEITDNKSKQQLIDEGLYYDVRPEDLIFLTKSEHMSLHNKGHKYWVGKHHSEESRKKMVENHSPYAGKPKKSVQCVETGEVFESLHSAARKHNLNRNCIRQCCNGKLQTTGGFHWRWI